MTFRNRLAVPLAAAVLAAVLAACSNSSPEAGRPDTAPPSSVEPSETTPVVTPSPSQSVPSAPPTRPATAIGSSLAAGEAFIAYYVDLLNYSYATGDPAPFLAASDKGCLGCQGVAQYTRKVNVKNGGVKGDYKDKLVAVKEIYRGESGRLGGSATIKSGTYEERLTPTASPVQQTSSDGTMEFTLSSNAGNWVMYEMQIDE
ncbi:DUF6318 family protein [Kribbella sp. ALI-6-A]|uniref:DUF6318 family protein n=1 Tax=Kribbella sp. ALI-6-A TaxID=1933817 RepID=UPI00117A807C|nr:DUF6318 family protein [Kribbella sp. ALI-6-A]